MNKEQLSSDDFSELFADALALIPAEFPRVHHPFSPSTLQMREACPCYSPTQGDNDASLAGTAQHAVAESGIDDERIPDYHAAAVAECMLFVGERARMYPGGKVLKEAYLPIDEEMINGFRGTTAGYVDVAIISEDETIGEIIDYKFGKNVVTDAETNLQGIAYLLGLKHRFPKLRRCAVHFLQPHIDHISSHSFDCENSDALYLRVRAVVHRAREAANKPDDFSSANPTISTCLFCANVGRCPKVAELVIKVGKKFAPLAVPECINTTMLADPAQVSLGLKLAQVVTVWAESFRRQASAKSLESDDFIPADYVLVKSQKTKIIRARGVGEAAKKFLPPEDAEKVDALYDISLGPLDKLISLRAVRGEKDATVELFRKQILAEGVAELGAEFTFLRQRTDKDTNKTANK